MPQILPENVGNLALQPTERGIDARLQAARRTQGFYNAAAEEINAGARAVAQAKGDAAKSFGNAAEATATFAKQQEDFAGHREIVAGSAAAAKLNAQLGDQWDAMVKNADPNDPSTAQKFRETVLEPSLQQFSEAYSTTDRGQQWSEAHVASMRNHFYQKTAADMSTLAGEAVKTSARTVINQNSNAAFKSPDFHTVDYLLDSTTSSVGAIVQSSPNVKGADSSRLRTEVTEKAKEQIVKAAAQGAIMKAADPEKVAQSFADRYPEYVNGAEAKQLAQAARTQAKTNFLQNKQIETYQKQQDDLKVHQAATKVMADNVATDPVTGGITIRPEYFQQALKIAHDYPNAPSAATVVHTAITWGEHQQNQKAQATISDPQVKADLYTRISDPQNPTTEIDLMKANVEGKLSSHDFSAMHGLQKAVQNSDLKTEAFKDTLAAAKASLTYSMPGIRGKDPKGLESYARFIQDFIPKYEAAKRSGTLPANALDFNDPKSLISQTMAAYKRTPQQLLRDRLQEMSQIGITNLSDTTITGVHTVNAPPVPAPAQREVGKIYELPKGRFKWNGAGWEKQ